ncbi:carbohydrate sulfotransferase 15-like, partial [Ruditapes philippinarum]|uniref:carbohydrate sulfotransferase 15-like n=1 Tax=Ruditapes philippinarum TaxID=129788 RepID=UPI00295BC62E
KEFIEQRSKAETSSPYKQESLEKYKQHMAKQEETKTMTTKAPPIIDKDVLRRNDTTPELTEKLPFLPDYKSPCWKELDEVLGPEVKINCLPYFYVVGVSQCGTKDLFERLTQHPLISGNMKPGNRWFTRLRFGGFPLLSDYLQYYYHAVETDIKRITTNDGYHNAIFGDFTPSTIWDNHFLQSAARKKNVTDPPYTNADVIKHLNPNARIIVLLCDPLERLFSDYIQIAEDFEAPPLVDEFHDHVVNAMTRFSNCLKNNTYLSCVYFGKPSSSYRAAGLSRIEIGLYHTHLANFMKVFPKNQMLIISKEMLDKDPAKILQKIFDFLDVGPIKDPIVWQHITSYRNTEHSRPIGDMKPETRKLIQDFYYPHNSRLTKLFGPDFDYNKNTSSQIHIK